MHDFIPAKHLGRSLKSYIYIVIYIYIYIYNVCVFAYIKIILLYSQKPNYDMW